jgi:hypothetical protein
MKSHFVDFERMAGELGLCFPDIDRDPAQLGQNINRQPLPIGILNDLTGVVVKELEERFEKFHSLAEVSDGDGNVIDRSSQHPCSSRSFDPSREEDSVTSPHHLGGAWESSGFAKTRLTPALQRWQAGAWQAVSRAAGAPRKGYSVLSLARIHFSFSRPHLSGFDLPISEVC